MMITEELRPLFETIKTHLLTQNEKSVTEVVDIDISSCRYRGPRGLKCAAGCLIPDEVYQISMEGKSVSGVQFFKQTYNSNEIRLISDFQYIHDYYPPYAWPDKINELEIGELKDDADDY